MTEAFPKLYTSADAAMLLGVKVCTVRNECHRGKLGHVIVGGRFIRHTEEHLREYLKNQEKRPCVTNPNDLSDGSGSVSFRSMQAAPISGVGHGSTSAAMRHAVSALARQTFAHPAKRSRIGSQSGTKEKKRERAA